MKWNKDHISRFVLSSEILPTGLYQDLVQVYSMKGALSYPAVRRWAQRFRVGRDSVEDDPRSGAPVTAATTDNAIKKLIDLDPMLPLRS